MTQEEKQAIIKEYATHEGDTGSPEVQVAVLTARINNLTEETFSPISRKPTLSGIAHSLRNSAFVSKTVTDGRRRICASCLFVYIRAVIGRTAADA